MVTIRGVAAPVFKKYGVTIVGISISGRSVRVTDERLAVLGPMVRERRPEEL
ncbi:IclR family transcriptional regulator C-terminal domain-containing protein [Sinorhizobium sp. 8-89]|uniref:IclR family transcriptional regulator domain-containing protein n=1 Tax=Sinorhizobium sp. 7-81 TaxID=3049087 RepID=UPI0024C43073|nr:IclR family transcriptional regulator C-terminal domain-containing protein [Sinorhizobium sp. 7-81]MDK1386038.1 IclR family transcriptional regulator C-terminal domain-containing protein [Sinorhizobium sp. 7-81]